MATWTQLGFGTAHIEIPVTTPSCPSLPMNKWWMCKLVLSFLIFEPKFTTEPFLSANTWDHNQWLAVSNNKSKCNSRIPFLLASNKWECMLEILAPHTLYVILSKERTGRIQIQKMSLQCVRCFLICDQTAAHNFSKKVSYVIRPHLIGQIL